MAAESSKSGRVFDFDGDHAAKAKAEREQSNREALLKLEEGERYLIDEKSIYPEIQTEKIIEVVCVEISPGRGWFVKFTSPAWGEDDTGRWFRVSGTIIVLERLAFGGNFPNWRQGNLY